LKKIPGLILKKKLTGSEYKTAHAPLLHQFNNTADKEYKQSAICRPTPVAWKDLHSF